jgi:uncharacterized membrane protein YeaQ/YmgE (transglycosylase-associated protein family)
MNAGAEIVVWIIVGARAGWLASRSTCLIRRGLVTSA